MNDRKCVENRKNLERQLTLVVLLALLTMAVMSSYIDSARAAEPASATASASAVAPGSAEGTPSGPDESPVNQYDGIIRLHVIANSDTKEDQELKLKVRNNVLAKVQNHLSDCFAREMETGLDEEAISMQRAEITREYIRQNLSQIETWAADAIKAEGFDYDVEAVLGVTWIPERRYDEIYFPAGNYEALKIIIGEGKGQNWWCVIFPPLCLIDGCNEEAAARMQKIYGEKIVLKSRILELLQGK